MGDTAPRRTKKKNAKTAARRGAENSSSNAATETMPPSQQIPREMIQRYGDAIVEVHVAKNARGVVQQKEYLELQQSRINDVIAHLYGPLNEQQRVEFDAGDRIGTLLKSLKQKEPQYRALNVAHLSALVRQAVQAAKDRMQRGADPCMPLSIAQEIAIMRGENFSRIADNYDDDDDGRMMDADVEARQLLMETAAVEESDNDSIDVDDHKLQSKNLVSQESVNNDAVNQWLTQAYKRGTKRNRSSGDLFPEATTEPSPATPTKIREEKTKRSKKIASKNDRNNKKDGDGDGEAETAEGVTDIIKKRLKERKKQKKEGASGGVSGNGVVLVANRPTTRFSDIGGIETVLDDIRELIEYPFSHPEIYTHLGVEPPRGILLHGPPGSGKTMLAHAIAGELGVPFFKVSAPEVVSGMSGESEKQLRQLFKDAAECAPSLIFIDEIDAITPKRENAAREMEKRIVAQLLICMDESSFTNTNGKVVMVIGATNRLDSLDVGLRRAGRFDREISLGIPDVKARAHILQVMCQKMRLSGAVDFTEIAKITPGYVGADIHALTKEAAAIAIHRIFSDPDMLTRLRQSTQTTHISDKVDQMHLEGVTNGFSVDIVDNSSCSNNNGNGVSRINDINTTISARSQTVDTLRGFTQPLSEEQLQHISIEMTDFQEAVKRVQPSAKREGFAMIPDVTWEDIGALEEIREELRLSIMEPIKNPEKFEKVGLMRPVGVLLFGPPGCGKTLLAKAIANSSGANFISVKGPELLNKYVGESERAVRQVFSRASTSAPCVVFFDELDALCPVRGNEGGNASTERVVNQLLTEMDGMDSRKEVFVIAATNRPDIIDPAMLRPGRLDKLLYVPLPNKDERLSILKTLTRKTPLDTNSVNLQQLAEDVRCENFSGADLAALVREASVQCLRGHLDLPAGSAMDMVVDDRHFEEAFSRVAPSVSAKHRRMYASLAKKVRFNSNHIPSADNGKVSSIGGEMASDGAGDAMEL